MPEDPPAPEAPEGPKTPEMLTGASAAGEDGTPEFALSNIPEDVSVQQLGVFPEAYLELSSLLGRLPSTRSRTLAGRLFGEFFRAECPNYVNIRACQEAMTDWAARCQPEDNIDQRVDQLAMIVGELLFRLMRGNSRDYLPCIKEFVEVQDVRYRLFVMIGFLDTFVCQYSDDPMGLHAGLLTNMRRYVIESLMQDFSGLGSLLQEPGFFNWLCGQEEMSGLSRRHVVVYFLADFAKEQQSLQNQLIHITRQVSDQQDELVGRFLSSQSEFVSGTDHDWKQFLRPRSTTSAPVASL